jgi:carbonic anhydrase
MDKLLKGVHKFQNSVFTEKRELFNTLAHEQHPRVLFITCSDSRVDPALITQTDPGELFVLRNAGNIIPPYEASMGVGQEATIDYAVHHLHIEHIVLCGHTDCGAIHALIETPEEELSVPLKAWLSCADDVRQAANSVDCIDDEDRLNKAIAMNVKLQLSHIATLPAVKEAMAARHLQLHGWVYCIHEGTVKEIICTEAIESV